MNAITTTTTTTHAVAVEIVRSYIAAVIALRPQDDATVDAYRRAEADLIDAVARATGIGAASISTYGRFSLVAGGALLLSGEGDHDVLRIDADGRIAAATGMDAQSYG